MYGGLHGLSFVNSCNRNPILGVLRFVGECEYDETKKNGVSYIEMPDNSQRRLCRSVVSRYAYVVMSFVVDSSHPNST